MEELHSVTAIGTILDEDVSAPVNDIFGPFHTASNPNGISVTSVNGILANDICYTGATLVVATQPQKGTVTVASNGGFVYRSNSLCTTGVDSFTYYFTKRGVISASASATITFNYCPNSLSPMYIAYYFVWDPVTIANSDVSVNLIIRRGTTTVTTINTDKSVGYAAYSPVGYTPATLTATLIGVPSGNSYTVTTPTFNAIPAATNQCCPIR